MSQRSLIGKETLHISRWICQFRSPVEVHLPCYGGSCIPALSASCLSPLSVVLLRLLIRFWFVACICCSFLSYFKLIVLTNMSGKGLISYGVVEVEMTESQPAAATQNVCSVCCEACTVNCLHQAALYALLDHLRTLSAAVYGVVMKARSCHHLRRNLWASLVLMGWMFWWKDWLWLVKYSQSPARLLHYFILSHWI